MPRALVGPPQASPGRYNVDRPAGPVGNCNIHAAQRNWRFQQCNRNNGDVATPCEPLSHLIEGRSYSPMFHSMCIASVQLISSDHVMNCSGNVRIHPQIIYTSTGTGVILIYLAFDVTLCCVHWLHA